MHVIGVSITRFQQFLNTYDKGNWKKERDYGFVIDEINGILHEASESVSTPSASTSSSENERVIESSRPSYELHVITLGALNKLLFFPAYSRWWSAHLSTPYFYLYLSLYITTLCFFFSNFSQKNPPVPFGEVATTCIMILLLSQLYVHVVCSNFSKPASSKHKMSQRYSLDHQTNMLENPKYLPSLTQLSRRTSENFQIETSDSDMLPSSCDETNVTGKKIIRKSSHKSNNVQRFLKEISYNGLFEENHNDEEIDVTIYTSYSSSVKSLYGFKKLSKIFETRINSYVNHRSISMVGVVAALLITFLPIYLKFLIIIVNMYESQPLPRLFVQSFDTMISHISIIAFIHYVVLIYIRVVVISSFIFLFMVAEKDYTHRLVCAKFFSAITVTRKAQHYLIPHFRLSSVKNIKMWLSLRSFLKRTMAKKPISIVISFVFGACAILLIIMALQVINNDQEKNNFYEFYLTNFLNTEVCAW